MLTGGRKPCGAANIASEPVSSRNGWSRANQTARRHVRRIRLGVGARPSWPPSWFCAARHRHSSASRAAGSFNVPRGILLLGAGRHPWSSAALAGL